MRLTGRNLRLVRYGVIAAIADVHNTIATCPDPDYYAEALKEEERQKAEFERLLERIDKAIEKEKT